MHVIWEPPDDPEGWRELGRTLRDELTDRVNVAAALVTVLVLILAVLQSLWLGGR